MATSFTKIRSFIRNVYNKSLLVSNTGTCVVLIGVGDCLTQYMEHKSLNAPTTPQAIASAVQNQTQMSLVNTTSAFNVDMSRNYKMLALGTAIGPFQHFWYTFLDKLFPVKTRSVIIKKVIIDQITFAPILNLLIICGLHFLGGERLDTLKSSIKEKFATLYAYDCALWVPAQTLNFSLVSNRYRVLYINMVTLVWNIISSFVMFNDVSVHSQFE